MDFIKRNWLGLLGLIVGVFGLVLSFYFYGLSQHNREPAILEINNFSIFSSPKGLTSDGFAFVTKPDLREITKNVYIHELVIWNKGKLPIKRSDIQKKLYLEYPEEVEVIDAFISSSTRPDIVNAKQSHSSSGNEIYLEFDILEQNDGFNIQVIYASDTQSAVSFKGSIEGVSNFIFADDLTKENIYFGIGKLVLIIFSILVALFGIGAVAVGFGWLIKKIKPEKSEKIKSMTSKAFNYLYYAFMAVLAVVFFVAMVNKFAADEGRNSVPNMKKPLTSQASGTP